MAVALAGLAACDRGEAPVLGGEGAGPPPVDEKKELAALGPPASAEVRALYEGDFEAVGQEPDWRLGMYQDWVSFSRPGLQEVGGMPGQKDVGEKGGRLVAGPLVITLQADECVYDEDEGKPRPGAEKFPYKARVRYEGVDYEGCARRGAAASAAAARWVARLGDLLPAIDACLARVEAKPGRVTLAYSSSDQVSVRLLDAQGGRYECGAALDGSKVEYWGSLADRDVLQGERDPIFIRTPGPPPTGACIKNEPAKSASGAALGWFSTTSC